MSTPIERKNSKIKSYSPNSYKLAWKKALDEAEAVDSVENGSMDNFNLLGVVATPGNLELPTDAITNSSDKPSSSSTNTGIAKTTEDSSFFNSFSKEIDSLNTTIHSYSRTYLGKGYFGDGSRSELNFQSELGYDDIPTNQLEIGELPEDLVSSDLTSVEAYIRKCGANIIRFGLRDGESETVLVGEGEASSGASHIQTSQMEKGVKESITSDSKKNVKLEDILEEYSTSSVPEIFFSPYFDLTDPKTFESLLVLDDESEGEQIADSTEDITIPKSLINIQNLDEFTEHLDTIELSLLNQVRSKSDSFFRETNRFSYLKSVVSESVKEVKSLRSLLQSIKDRTVTDVELVPLMDKRRDDLKVLCEVLDEVIDIVEVKGSVPGLIAAGDYLAAVEAIHMARGLLKGSKYYKKGGGEIMRSSQNSDCDTESKRFALGKLTALNKVNDQLAEYENLVVMDLSNELIEKFLTWEGHNANSTFSTMNSFMNGSSVSRVPFELRSKVKHSISALKMSGKLTTMANLYRDKLCDIIRVTVRTTVNECAADAVANKKLLSTGTNTKSVHDKKLNEHETGSKLSITEGVTSITFNQFMDCLDMIFEQVLGLLESAVAVSKFCKEEAIFLKDDDTGNLSNEVYNSSQIQTSSSSQSALYAAADLSHKSISELLRLRKEAHSLIPFEEMKRLWDSCLVFTLQVEKFSGQKAYGLRSTLLAQAKAFVERRHEGNMANLAAALDGEKWSQCDVSSERQAALTRLCSGRAVMSSSRSRKWDSGGAGLLETSPDAEIEGKHYRVVWSCLLLVEMAMSNVECAAHFQTLATNIVGKVSELLRLFNTRSSQLVLGARALKSAARLKSINAKHLAMVTQCLGLVLGILPHIRAALMAQLPSKQHTLLVNIDKIKKEYTDHNENVLNKFVVIITNLVEHGLLKRIDQTDFDARSKLPITRSSANNTQNDAKLVPCCPFLEGVVTNTRKMHQVLSALLPPEDLMDVFSRIFAYLDSKIPTFFISADLDDEKKFSFPISIEGTRRMISEVRSMTATLNCLEGVRPWDFGAMTFLERRLLGDSPHIDDSKNEDVDDTLFVANVPPVTETTV